MPELTAKEKLEIRQKYESAQLERDEERTAFRADVPKRAKGSESPKVFKLLETVDAYLKHCELTGSTENNELYSHTLALRDIAVERLTALVDAHKAAVDAANKAQEDKSQ